MKTLLSPHLSPTSCLEVDSPAARDLTWLPYAVRFKLDTCGLRMSLREWQGLPLAQRTALVRAPLVDGAGGFEPLALALGARPDPSGARREEVTLDAGDFRWLHDDARAAWTAGATAFSKYVLRKIATKEQAREAA